MGRSRTWAAPACSTSMTPTATNWCCSSRSPTSAAAGRSGPSSAGRVAGRQGDDHERRRGSATRTATRWGSDPPQRCPDLDGSDELEYDDLPDWLMNPTTAASDADAHARPPRPLHRGCAHDQLQRDVRIAKHAQAHAAVRSSSSTIPPWGANSARKGSAHRERGISKRSTGNSVLPRPPPARGRGRRSAQVADLARAQVHDHLALDPLQGVITVLGVQPSRPAISS